MGPVSVDGDMDVVISILSYGWLVIFCIEHCLVGGSMWYMCCVSCNLFIGQEIFWR